MKRLLPAAILSVILNLIDARQQSRHEHFAMQTFPVGDDRYHVSRSTDLRSVTVRYEPNLAHRSDLQRRIDQRNQRIAMVEPIAKQRFSSDDSDHERKAKGRDGAKEEIRAKRAEIAAFQAEIDSIETGWTEEYNILDLAEQKLFGLVTNDIRALGNTPEQQEAVETIEALRDQISLTEDEDLLEAVQELYEEWLDGQATDVRRRVQQTFLECAELCHEANRKWCASIGDDSQKPWSEADEWQRDSAVAGVRFFVENPGAAPSAQHDAWSDQKIAEGWVYGPVKDADLKTHPCLVPYDELPIEQRAKDALFQATCSAYFPLDWLDQEEEDPFRDSRDDADTDLHKWETEGGLPGAVDSLNDGINHVTEAVRETVEAPALGEPPTLEGLGEPPALEPAPKADKPKKGGK